MDKPQSLSMREYLVRTLAVKLMLSEKVIDSVIVHQFSEANAAMSSNDSIEISGFGKFLFNQKKAHKQMEKFFSKEKYFSELLKTDLSEAKKQSTLNKLNNNTLAIEALKPKLK